MDKDLEEIDSADFKTSSNMTVRDILNVECKPINYNLERDCVLVSGNSCGIPVDMILSCGY